MARYNTYGYPGLIDMPSAVSRPDAELAITSSHFQNQTRNTLTFQITPRLSGSFRYAQLYDIRPNPGGAVAPYRFDRSFSLHYRLMDEEGWQPAVAVGLNDFLGTGLYSSEYVVATKTLAPGLRLTGGMGWGRLATHGGFQNPLSIIGDSFKNRPPRTSGMGGEVEWSNWFRGDAALFGGVEWQATDNLSFALEYSSDAYPNEDGSAFNRRSPVNFGVAYRFNPSITLGVNYLYGSELGFQLTLATNPKHPGGVAGYDRGAMPVLPRKNAAQLGWSVESVGLPTVEARVAQVLANNGLRLHGIRAEGDTLRVEVENERFANSAQVIGRTARALTNAVPAGVESFTIVPVENGLAGAAVTLRRTDLEELEFDYDNSWRSYARAQIVSDAGPLNPVAGRYPRFEWDLKPYLSPSLFDPDSPLRADLGAELSAVFQPAQGLVFKGSLRKKVIGNLDASTRASTSVLPHVRSDFNIYEREGDPAVTELVGAYYFKPGANLYGRVTAGYLEPMYGGISTELLWQPLDSRFALGAELNYVRQRDFDQMFGFRDYDVATGHVSAYWDFGNGFTTQVDVGRYLAKDWGTTFSIDREFRNGWRIGVFATLTDVSFDDFGEGSFDKGLRLTIPINFISGQPTTEQYSTVIRPVTRDGGARLNVSGRLYETVRRTQKTALRDGWGRFWK
ncbi:YjbH domain-containing protein [Aquicoccus sp. SU-CL01552]|uniref:YjbH domain-containing protein n=1 Tax=Aquicoccus sp. SU-CL01552 TaxID=3127656 RepID=UPI00310316D8